MTTTTSSCSECSQLKEDLGDVNRRLNTQEIEMDTLCQLLEGLRSNMLTAPLTPLPTARVQTSTPVDSPASIPCPISPLSLPASTGITSHTTVDILDHQAPGQSPCEAPVLLEGEGSPVMDPHPIHVPTDLLMTLWSPTGDDAHSPQSDNSGADEDYVPPPHPLLTHTSSDSTIVADTPAVPPPTIVVTSPDVLSVPGPTGIPDGLVGDGVETHMDTTT